MLLYGAKYDDVDRIVNLCGRFDLKVGVEERIGVEGLKTLEAEGVVHLEGYSVTTAGLKERLATDMSVVEKVTRGNRSNHGEEFSSFSSHIHPFPLMTPPSPCLSPNDTYVMHNIYPGKTRKGLARSRLRGCCESSERIHRAPSTNARIQIGRYQRR